MRGELEGYFDECSLPADLKYDLLTCIYEAATNAARLPALPANIAVAVDAAEVLVTARDHGVGLDVELLTGLPPDPPQRVGSRALPAASPDG